MAITKAINPLRSTLKAGKGIKLVDDGIRESTGRVIGDLGLARGKTDYGKFASPGHKKYLESLGPMPKDSARGVKRVNSSGKIDDYTD